jgi:hypothetical protein
MAWNILKISPEMAELILARFLEWVLKVNCAASLSFVVISLDVIIFPHPPPAHTHCSAWALNL